MPGTRSQETIMLTCRELNERATDYLEGQMSLRQRAGFKLHLLMCSKCGTYVDQLAKTIALLRVGRPTQDEAAPDDKLIEAFRATAANSEKPDAR
jgi:predicted anti-sigma-YlaC factor YlaD